MNYPEKLMKRNKKIKYSFEFMIGFAEYYHDIALEVVTLPNINKMVTAYRRAKSGIGRIPKLQSLEDKYMITEADKVLFKRKKNVLLLIECDLCVRLNHTIEEIRSSGKYADISKIRQITAFLGTHFMFEKQVAKVLDTTRINIHQRKHKAIVYYKTEPIFAELVNNVAKKFGITVKLS